MPHLCNQSSISLDVKTEAPSVVIVSGTPQHVAKSLIVLMILAESSRASWKILNQLEYLSTVAR